jgi:hypothetical protein
MYVEGKEAAHPVEFSAPNDAVDMSEVPEKFEEMIAGRQHYPVAVERPRRVALCLGTRSF